MTITPGDIIAVSGAFSSIIISRGTGQFARTLARMPHASAGPTRLLSMDPTSLTATEAWALAYRIRPYLQLATQEELQERAADIARNLYTLSPEGKLQTYEPASRTQLWAQKWTDLRLEYRRRNLPTLVMRRPDQIPLFRTALILARANGEFSALARIPNVFCRYGDLWWMKALYERGELLLSPASFYKAAEHGNARQDDELKFPVIITPYDYDLGKVPPAILARRPQRSWIRLENIKPADHYLYCVTVGFSLCQAVDFGTNSGPATAAVVVRDQQVFEDRLLTAMRKRLPRWHVEFDMAKYIDPYCVVQVLPNEGTEVFYFKNFRYMHQHEHRAIALPPPDMEGPFTERIPLSIGSLTDIAELVEFRRPIAW